MRTHGFLLIACLAAAACTEAEPTTDEVEVADDDGKADGTTETKVRTGETSVWVRNEIKRETRTEGRQVLVVRGRASRDVLDGSAFVFDDVNGDWASRGVRSYEVAYAADDGGLLDGNRHFHRLHFKPSDGRPDTLTTSVIARTKLTSFTGDGAYLVQDVAPIVYGGRTMWRVRGTASSKIYGLRASMGDVRQLDDRKFVIDLLHEHVVALVGTSDTLDVELDLYNGTHTKSAKLVLKLKSLGITSEDPYEVWPPLACTDEVRGCLEALPPGTLDLSSCGEAREVRVCQGQTGVTFDDVAFQAAIADANARLSSAAMRSDYAALAGTDRVEQLQGIAEQTVEAALEGLFGTWYADAAARDLAVDGAVESAIDQIYAYPMDIVEPHPPAPGNLAGTRQVVADALLAYLASIDLAATEFGRPLVELTRLFRTRHVADLRAWRTTVTAQDAGNGRDVYIGNWLDPYVEITVNRSTGVVEGVFFEID